MHKNVVARCPLGLGQTLTQTLDVDNLAADGGVGDDDGTVFAFPNYEMATNFSCRIYTNESHPDYCGFSFGSGRAIGQ